MVIILLATYNGERYISELIESILAQTVQDFKVIVCDDRSTDSTFSIVNSYAEKNPGKIVVSQNETNTGSPKFNFLQMMIEYKNDYVMLCDQDDVWLPDKIDKCISKIREMETEFGSSMPVLVHTDLKVVDEDLNLVSSSYEKMSNKDFSITALNFVLTMNNAAGCTTIYNKALAEYIQTVPGFFVMHDWWLALTAAVFGKIGTVTEPTVLYRQHGENDKGAKRVLSPRYVFYVLTHIKTMKSMIEDSYKQAGAFLEVFGDKITGENKELISIYAALPLMPRMKRLKTVNKYKTYMYGFARKAVQIFFIKTTKKKQGGTA